MSVGTRGRTKLEIRLAWFKRRGIAVWQCVDRLIIRGAHIHIFLLCIIEFFSVKFIVFKVCINTII